MVNPLLGLVGSIAKKALELRNLFYSFSYHGDFYEGSI